MGGQPNQEEEGADTLGQQLPDEVLVLDSEGRGDLITDVVHGSLNCGFCGHAKRGSATF